MGLSRKNSAVNTPALARQNPSNTTLNSLVTPTSNGINSPTLGHDRPHSANTSTPSSPAGSIGSGTDSKEFKYFDNTAVPASPDKANAVPKDGQKNPMSRLTRMFSQSGRDKEKQKELERKKLQQQEKLSVSPVGEQQPHSGATSPLPKHSEKDGDSSDTDNAPSRGSSVAGDHPKSRNVSAQHAVKNGDGAVVPFVRFEMLEDGVNHVHHLRATKRQEKLSTLLQSWLGGGKKIAEEEKPAPLKDQLSLMHSWVNEVKSEKMANVKKDGPAASASLVEKYGRCQEVIGRGMSPYPSCYFVT